MDLKKCYVKFRALGANVELNVNQFGVFSVCVGPESGLFSYAFGLEVKNIKIKPINNVGELTNLRLYNIFFFFSKNTDPQ